MRHGFWIVWGCLFPLGLWAQTNSAPLPSAVNTTEQPPTGLADELAASDLPEEQRTTLSAWLDRAQSLDRRAVEHVERLAELRDRILNIEALQASMAEQAAQLPASDLALPASAEEGDLTSLQAQLSQEQAEFDILKAEEERATALETPATLAQRIAGLSAELEAARAAVQTEPVGGESALADRIQRALAEAQVRDLEGELALLRYQLDHHEELNALAAARRQFRALESRIRTNRLAQLRDWVERARAAQSSEVRISAERAEREADQLAPDLREFAQGTADLGRELESVTQEEIATRRETTALVARTEELARERDVLRRRFEAVGSSATMGRLLLKRWVDNAYQSREGRGGLADRERVGEIISRRLDLDEDVSDPELRERLRTNLRTQVAESGQAVDEQGLDSLVASRAEVLEALADAYRRLDTAIAQLQIASAAAREEARRLSESLEQWLMWTRTAPTLSLSEVMRWPGMVVEHARAVAREIPARAAAAWTNHRPALMLGPALLFVLLGIRPRITRRIEELDRRVAKIRSDRFLYTLEGILWAAIRALPIPGLFLLLGFVFADEQATSSFHAMSRSLYLTAAALFYLLFLSETVRPGGLGVRHLRWSKAGCAHFRRELRWFIPAFGALQLVSALTGILPLSFAEPVMRVYLLAIVGISAAAALRLLRTESQWSLKEAADKQPSVFIRWRVMWRGLVVFLVGALIYLFILGFGYTAVRFFELILVSQAVAVGMVYLRELSLRAVSVSERRLRFQQQVQKLTESRRPESATEEAMSDLMSIEEPAVDFSGLGEKARRLINGTVLILSVVVLAQLWMEYLPLINALDEVTLPLNKTILVSGESQVVPLNLADLLTAAAIAFMVAVAAVNLPALLEIIVLQQLPMDQGARYAIVTLLQYLIVGVGIAMVCSHLGFSWSSIQWLAAAMGVGLGFGLQEIVANFISGIIILFERPVRVGDIVTMGDTTGVVSRIRIRATTVVNWDKQELLIPNKEFITGRLLNWTLSDKLNRILIPIGVAYGTDTRRALALAREIVEGHPQVLREPKPLLTFEGFGDSSLNLFVRCYLESLEFRLDTLTELHTQIHERFRQEGIEIAFPQLDVHWKNPPPPSRPS